MSKLKVIFYGELQNGEFKLHNRDRFNKYVGKFAGIDKTKPVRIKMTVEKVYKTRSIQQLRYYWGVVVALVADELGYFPWERNEVHEALKTNVGGLVGDERLPVAKSTSLMDTLEFDQYIENCRRWASVTLGIEIPDPTKIEPDDYFKEFIHS